MSKRLYRTSQSLLLFVTVFIVFMSFYFEYALGLHPCPLCLMQRFCAILFGMFCLMGLCLSTLKRARLVTEFQLFFSLAGFYFSGRQIWLQSLPAEKTPACLPGLDIMLSYFQWNEILLVLFWGAGDCAEQHWQWLGLSMPTWSALYFLGMFAVSGLIFILLWRNYKKVAG